MTISVLYPLRWDICDLPDGSDSIFAQSIEVFNNQLHLSYVDGNFQNSPYIKASFVKGG